MNAPVNTAALRTAGERADYYQTGDGPLWRAAADEMDRLWESLHDRENEVDRLRIVIEDAPHEPQCDKYSVAQDDELPRQCDCWKADAL